MTLPENELNFPVINLYTKSGCHLCEDVLAYLRKLEYVVLCELNIIDIEQDDTLIEKYGLMIPVVEINGELVTYGNVDKKSIERNFFRAVGKNISSIFGK